MIHSESSLCAMAAHGCCRGSDPFRALVSHHCGTWVSESALFMTDLISATSTTKLYFLVVLANVASGLHISISLDALVVSRAFPVSVSVIHWCVHTETVTMWSPLACNGSARLTPFKETSSSARFWCLASFSGRSQQAASTMTLLVSRATLMASELASTQTN